MKKHISTSLMNQLLENTLDNAKKVEVMGHISACPKCQQEFELLKKIDPLPTKKEAIPPAFIRDNVLAFYEQRVQTKKETSLPKTPFSVMFLRPVPLLTSIGAIIIAVFSMFLWGPLKTNSQQLFFSINEIQGPVLINSRPITSSQQITEHTTLTTKEKGSLVLVHSDCVRIKLHANTSLSIIKLREETNPIRYNMKFSLQSGSLYSHFSHKQVMTYAFSTPHAVIISGGTTFSLAVTKDKTTITLNEGHVIISTKTNKKPIMAQTGKIYDIDNTGKINTEPHRHGHKNSDHKKKFRLEWP